MKKGETNLQVLVVSDEPFILWGLCRYLAKFTMVKTVATTEEALDEIREHNYDLCFLDFNLPWMTELDAMKIINEQSPNTKVVLMSGSFVDEAMREWIEGLAYAFIEKPFELSRIMGVAKRAAVAPN